MPLGDEEEDAEGGSEERFKKKGAADEEKERVAGVIYGLGEVLEQVKEVIAVFTVAYRRYHW